MSSPFRGTALSRQIVNAAGFDALKGRRLWMERTRNYRVLLFIITSVPTGSPLSPFVLGQDSSRIVLLFGISANELR
jgi:hypothetical protein